MTERAEIKVGVAGWSYADWEGVVYASRSGRGARDPIRVLGACVDLIEINSSFYGLPGPRAVLSWLERASTTKLVFSAKAPSACTHERAEIREVARAFREVFRPLHEAGRLCAILAQYPFYFEPEAATRDDLLTLAEALRPWPIVFELRAPRWTSEPEREFLRREGLDLACIDMPGDAEGHGREISGQGSRFYLRLHGRNGAAWFRQGSTRDQAYDYLYTPAELAPWIERAEAARQRARPAAIVANNHFRGQALVNAIQMRALVEGRSVAAPAELLARYPVLASSAFAARDPAADATPSLFEGLPAEE